jgi:hypothetical protein
MFSGFSAKIFPRVYGYKAHTSKYKLNKYIILLFFFFHICKFSIWSEVGLAILKLSEVGDESVYIKATMWKSICETRQDVLEIVFNY